MEIPKEKKPKYVDPDLQFLNDILGGKNKEQVVIPEDIDGVMKPQTYIVQWDGIIQSFETGIITTLGMLYSACENADVDSPIRKLHPEIMKQLDYWEITEKKKLDEDIFDYILTCNNKFAKKNKLPEISKEDMQKIREEVEDKVFNDEFGILIDVSPYLTALNSLINIYVDKTVASLIFYFDDKIVGKFKGRIRAEAKRLFVRDKNVPIYLEFSQVSFTEFFKNLTDGYSTMDAHHGTVIMTTDRDFISETTKNKKIHGLSLVFPVVKDRDAMNSETPAILHWTKPSCEYVGYTNKPLKL